MVHQKRENAEQRDRNHDHDSRTLQFVPGGPRALFQLFPRLLHVSGQALELPLPPKETKDRARDHHPDQSLRCLVHKSFPACRAAARTVCLLRTARRRGAPARQPSLSASLRAKAGGEGGIRTPVPLARKAVFKTAAIDHSATSPSWLMALG